MNLSKPLHIIILGSIMLSLMILLVLLIIQFTGSANLGLSYFIFIPLTTGLVSFGLFSFLIEKFINQKIKLIYRIISSQKLSSEMI